MANYRNLAGAGVFLACASLCASFEGLDTRAYHDTLAHGLPTICYGETEGVKMGDHYTPIECKEMLAKKLPRYWNEISLCIHVPISDNEKVAYTDFAYNVGSGRPGHKGGFCGSGTLKRLNAGDHTGACNGLLAWDMASGKAVPGLERRRAAERELCLRKESSFDTAMDAFDDDAPAPIIAEEPKPLKHKRDCSGYHYFDGCHDENGYRVK